MLKRLYDWMGRQVHRRHAEAMLCFLFYLEAIFFLPTDPMLIVYCLERQDKAYRFATIALIGSVLGGLTGYLIGYFFWDYAGEAILNNSVVQCVIPRNKFDDACSLYQKYEVAAILIAGFTPVPYKIATLTAGVCKLSIIPFIFASIIARGSRFFLLAGLIKKYGNQMREYIDRYFNVLVLLVLFIIGLSIWLCT